MGDEIKSNKNGRSVLTKETLVPISLVGGALIMAFSLGQVASAVQENGRDITELKTITVPRSEVEVRLSSIQESLARIEKKLEE